MTTKVRTYNCSNRVGGGGGERIQYKTDGQARRLALGGKLQILVSLRVFGMESHYNFKETLVMKQTEKQSLT